MSEEDGFNPIMSAHLKNGGSMSMKFPIPEALHSVTLAFENTERSIEYYLLARYAYLHKMHSAFMINSFWAVEHLILSILILEITDIEELKKLGVSIQ